MTIAIETISNTQGIFYYNKKDTSRAVQLLTAGCACTYICDCVCVCACVRV
jgi:hypothetical protein